MSSINTNASAMTALQTLNSISKNLSTTQERISTGLRVNSASDNAAYWSISTTMKSDNGALSSVQDNLGLGASKLDTAYTGMNKVIDAANQIKNKLVSAVGASDSDKAKIQTEVKALQDQMKGYATASTFSGSNMLSVDTTDAATAGTADTISIVSSYNRDSSGAVSIGTIDIDAESVKLFDTAATDETNQGILEATRASTGARATAQAATLGDDAAAGDTYAVSDLQIHDGTNAASDSQIQDMIGAIEGALKDMTTAATTLGAAKNSVSLQQDFNSQLMDSIDRGVGQLVDADMNQESARLSALQVQQQLGIQSLSIANSNSQNILSLFRG